MQGPAGRRKEGDVAHLQIRAAREPDQARTEALRPPPFVFRVVMVHELRRAPVDRAGAGDAQALRRSSHVIAAPSAEGKGIGGHQDLRVVRQMKIDPGLEDQGAGQVALPSAEKHPRVAGRRSLVHGALDGRGVRARAIAGRAVVGHVEYPAAWGAAGSGARAQPERGGEEGGRGQLGAGLQEGAAGEQGSFHGVGWSFSRNHVAVFPTDINLHALWDVNGSTRNAQSSTLRRVRPSENW